VTAKCGRRTGHGHRVPATTAPSVPETRGAAPEIPQDRAVADTERGQLDQADRDDVAELGAAHEDRPGYRRQGMSIASRREWCRYRADILDIIEGAACLDRELLAGNRRSPSSRSKGTAPHPH
jgi:hypothetical protein